MASKDMSGIKIFKNAIDLSKIQCIFLSNLYNFETIYRDIITENISKHVLDNHIYWNSYFLWKQKKSNKQDIIRKKHNNVNLVTGKKIIFKKDK